MFELNKIIGIDDSRNNILVTLTDGRCALVDLKRKGFVVEVLLDSFFKWMSFSDNYTEEDIDNVKSILANPQGVGYGSLAERYISDTKVKQKFDKIKKKSAINIKHLERSERFFLSFTNNKAGVDMV